MADNVAHKMIMILCPSSQLEHVQKLIDGHHVHGYTEILEVRGAGVSGKHLGTRAWPGTSALVFSVVEAARVDELTAAVRALATRCSPGEGLRAFVLPVEAMV
jgi:nitrogen regulatory protein PII